MELDELKAAWAQQAQRLDHLEAVALQAWRAPRQAALRRRLRWFSGVQFAWLLVWILVTVLAAGFWVGHWQQPHLLLTGLAFHAYGIAAIWVSVNRAVMATRVDSADAPVVTQQLRLARLRRFTALTELGLGLPWFCLWLLALQWACVRWLGLDLYLMAPHWFLWTLGVGVIGMIAGVGVARWSLQRLDERHWLRRWLDGLSGQLLQRAQRQLREIEDYRA